MSSTSLMASLRLVAFVRSVTSGPLGKNISHETKMPRRAACAADPGSTPERMFGSNDTEPPRAFTSAMAWLAIVTMREEKSEDPDTCKWPHSSSISRACPDNSTFPAALFLRLNMKSRWPSWR